MGFNPGTLFFLQWKFLCKLYVKWSLLSIQILKFPYIGYNYTATVWLILHTHCSIQNVLLIYSYSLNWSLHFSGENNDDNNLLETTLDRILINVYGALLITAETGEFLTFDVRVSVAQPWFIRSFRCPHYFIRKQHEFPIIFLISHMFWYKQNFLTSHVGYNVGYFI